MRMRGSRNDTWEIDKRNDWWTPSIIKGKNLIKKMKISLNCIRRRRRKKTFIKFISHFYDCKLFYHFIVTFGIIFFVATAAITTSFITNFFPLFFQCWIEIESHWKCFYLLLWLHEWHCHSSSPRRISFNWFCVCVCVA